MRGSRNAVDVARQELRPPEWVVFTLAVTADISIAAGFVPFEYLAVFRSLVIFCLYREFTLALVCGFVLPRFVPLAGVCFLKQKWLALKVSDAICPVYSSIVLACFATDGDRRTELHIIQHLAYSSGTTAVKRTSENLESP